MRPISCLGSVDQEFDGVRTEALGVRQAVRGCSSSTATYAAKLGQLVEIRVHFSDLQPVPTRKPLELCLVEFISLSDFGVADEACAMQVGDLRRVGRVTLFHEQTS